MKKILYVMHVNWLWIKQRPHFLAEGISDENELNVLHPVIYNKKLKSKEKKSELASKTYFKLPDRFISKSKVAYETNKIIVGLQILLKTFIFKPEILWLTHPIFSLALRFISKEVKIIYDCMDDHAMFWERGDLVLKDEKYLFSRADIVLFSSGSLADRKNNIFKIKNFHVVNNGCADYLIKDNSEDKGRNINLLKMNCTIGYFGAVASWFDWDLINEINKNFPCVQINIAGPIENINEFPSGNKSIKYFGVLRHDELRSFSLGCDILIMPFKINELVSVVDPVKLYEYVSFGKYILAPDYIESRRFQPYIDIYKDSDDCINLIKKFLEGDKSDVAIPLEFLKRNTWGNRVNDVKELIRNI